MKMGWILSLAMGLSACGEVEHKSGPMNEPNDSRMNGAPPQDASEQNGKRAPRSSPPQKVMRIPTGFLCLMRNLHEENDVVFSSAVVDRVPDDECVREGPLTMFGLNRDEEYTFWLHGISGISYCITVQRDAGFLEIFAETGTVTWERRGTHFQWCTQGSAHPTSLMIRSKTARSIFQLLLNGME